MTKAYYIGQPPEDYDDLYERLLPGAHVVLWCNSQTYPRVTCALEDSGFEIRDCLFVFSEKEVMPLPLAMKPLEGNFADNALTHGVAGLNIDGTRIGIEDTERDLIDNRSGRGDQAENVTYQGSDRGEGEKFKSHVEGRFPSNVILMHSPGCKCLGTKKVKPSNGSGRATPAKGVLSNIIYGKSIDRRSGVFGVVGADGTETVADWTCVPGCASKALDDQTLDKIHGAGKAREGLDANIDLEGYTFVAYGSGLGPNKHMHRFGDSGGGSRFFKQVQNEDDLEYYLEDLLRPPK